MKPKTAKLMSILLCAVLAVVLIFTMIAGALALSPIPPAADVDTGDTGIIINVPGEDYVVGTLEGVQLLLTAASYPASENGAPTALARQLYAGKYFDGRAVVFIGATYLTVAQDNPEKGFFAGDALPGAAITGNLEVWIPLTEELLSVRGLRAAVSDSPLSSSGAADGAKFTSTPAYIKEFDGVKYYVFEVGVNDLFVLICEADENHKPLQLNDYEKGFVGILYRFRYPLLMLLIAIALFIGFFASSGKPKNNKIKSSNASDESEPNAEETKNPTENKTEPAEPKAARAIHEETTKSKGEFVGKHAIDD